MYKLLHVISDTNIGGAGRVLLLLLKHTDTAQFDVTVAVPRAAELVPRLKKLGVKYIETDVGRDTSHESGGVAAYKKIIKELKPDIVHTHASLDAKIAAKECRVPVRVYTRHSVFDPPKTLTTFPGKLVSGTFNNTLSTDVIAVAEAAKENLIATGVDAKKITVILNGVEPLEKISAEERAAVRADLGFKESDFVCGLIARFEPYKGHTDLLEIAEKIKAQRNNVKFILLGAGSCYTSICEETEKRGLTDTVFPLGFRNDTAPYCNAMDLALNCSWGTEATSLALLETMSLGIPAVVTNFGGNPGVIADGVNGLVTPVRDTQAMADAILRLADNPELYSALSAGAEKIYAERFTADVMTRKTEEVYIKALNRKKK